jgi:glutamate-1-semialdehyde 2,1-aminomutase
LLSVFFGVAEVTDYDSAKRADHARYAQLFHGMLAGGVLLPPSGYEGWFLSAAHTDEDVERVVEAFEAVTSRW